MSFKSYRTAKTTKHFISSPEHVPAKAGASVLPEKPPSQCGILDIEELARKEGDLHKLIETEITELFESLDTYGNGYLTLSDIKSAYQTFDIEIEDEDAQAIMDSFDDSGEGHINFSEFRKEMYDVMLGGTLEEHIKLLFNAIDHHGDGYFGFQEVMRCFQKLGAKSEPEEAMEAFREISGGSELVDFDLFKAYCEHLDRAKKLADTPITAITKKDDKETSRKLAQLQGRKISMTSSLASQTLHTMKAELEKIKGSDEEYDYGGRGGMGGRGMEAAMNSGSAPKRPVVMNLFAASMMK